MIKGPLIERVDVMIGAHMLSMALIACLLFHDARVVPLIVLNSTLDFLVAVETFRVGCPLKWGVAATA